MGILDLARGHLGTIMGSEAIGFVQDVTFTTPDGLTTVTVKGVHSTHHNGFDSEGFQNASKVSSVSVKESVLTDAGYPVRNVEGDVAIEEHRVSAADSTGVVREYVVKERQPDAMLGLLVLILQDYAV